MVTAHPLQYAYLSSPLGQLLLAADAQGLCHIGFPDGRLSPAPQWQENPQALRSTMAQLSEYFAGIRRHFQLPLNPQGTVFQRRVWQALGEIPHGQTWSYGQLARYLGKPTASRAVGGANGANPLPIVIPCHRVIGGDGSLTGFGGGLALKRWLLDHEGASYRETPCTID